MNQCQMMGRLVSDPVLRSSTNGNSVCNIRVAVDRKIRRENNPTADFFTCVAWGKTAEHIAKWYKKGKSIGLNGSIQNRDYLDNNNIKRSVTEINIDDVYFCGDKKADDIPYSPAVDNNQDMTQPQILDDPNVNGGVSNGDDLPF